MPMSIGDMLRASTNFSATETNLTNLKINGTPRDGLYAIARWTGVTGGTNQVTTIVAGSRPTGGTFALTIGGVAVTINTTDPNATVQAKILAMQNIVLGSVLYPTLKPDAVVVTGGGATGWATADLILTLGGQLANQAITVTNSTALTTGGGTFSVSNTTAGVGPTCNITFQDGDDGTTWRSPSYIGSIYCGPGLFESRPILVETQRKYLSATLAYGGSGTFTKLQLGLTPFMEGIG